MIVSDKFAVFFIFFVCLLGASVFHIKYLTVALEGHVKTAKADIKKYKNEYRILLAEWQAISTPNRIQKLANKHLHAETTMVPMRVVDNSIKIKASDRGQRKGTLSDLMKSFGNE